MRDARTRSKEWRARCRSWVLEFLGGRCMCCDETNFDFLEVDHIHNDGAIDRRQGLKDFSRLWARLRTAINPKARYQLLCANCHTAKTHGVVCIHRRAEVAIEAFAFGA